ncbi:formylmethanofuran dehydrogenase subunit C [Prosthecomicrobium sp. N25]|uniref:formylmethanofuran dehydrogenase subunit C n=1 Tax=Prosthecomicrobium sp. N25 TaxID=3129254 RepID=UPI0030770A8D
MAALTLRLLGEPPERLDLSAVTPAALAGLSAAAIAAIPVGTTAAGLRLGDVFAIAGDDPSEIRIEGGSPRLDRVGMGLESGSIRVAGSVGLEAGRGMKGGTLTVEGDAGHRAGAGMTGGTLAIGGDAGDFAGGALHGAMAGQDGGILLVRGRTGERTGDRMKRGLVVVLGGTGPHPGSRMAGGTILTAALGDRPGTLMKRGTLIAATVGDLGPTFVPSGGYELPFLGLFARHLAATLPEAASLVPRRAERLRGDMAALGKGEILLASR